MTPATDMPAASNILFPDRDPAGPPPISVGELVGMLWRNVWLIIACVVLVTALALGLYFLQVPVYSSTARVLVQTDQLGTPSFLSGIAAYRESQIAEPVSRKIETEMALILNRSNAVRVADELQIRTAQLPSSPIGAAMDLVTGTIARWTGGAKAGAAPGARAKLIDDFMANISVEAVRSKTAETTSNVLEVKLDTTDPVLAPRALAAMLDAYLQVGTLQNRRLGSATTDLLKSQIEDAQAELSKTESAIVALAVRESERTEVTAAASGIRTAPPATGAVAGRRDVGRGANETATAQLVQQLLDLQGQLDELRQTFTDETDSVRKLKQRVAEARSRLASQVRASAINNAEFSRLERQRLLAQDHYVELRRKLDQIDLYMQLTPAALDGRLVVDAPTQPERGEARRKKLIVLAGPVAGLLLGLLLAALRELTRQRVRTRRDVERLLGVPLLGTLPSYRRGSTSALFTDTHAAPKT